MVGRFRSCRDLRFFDFTALSKRYSLPPLSIFDPVHDAREMKRRLLRLLHEEIAKPVRISDTDYLMTQALAEHIRYGTNLDFDGIMFQSVQHAAGTNYVLFDKIGDEVDRLSSDWRAKFDVEIVQEDIAIYEVRSIDYNVELKKRS